MDNNLNDSLITPSQNQNDEKPSNDIPMTMSLSTKTINPEKIKEFYTTMLCSNFFKYILSVKMIHWQTNKFSVHETTDQFSTQIENLMDDLVETIQGEILEQYASNNDEQFYKNNMDEDYDKYKVNIDEKCSIQIQNQFMRADEDGFISLLKKFQNFLTNEFVNIELMKIFPNIKENESSYSSILTIRDELVKTIQKNINKLLSYH
jgi:DNA-binding ferritin-like protein